MARFGFGFWFYDRRRRERERLKLVDGGILELGRWIPAPGLKGLGDWEGVVEV